ncbi:MULTISPECIES: alpha/beta hydrolase [unclassified Streptomyces]|uniref:alpha/beta hydrolase n=1 Tax=unclassified Streptomyces TaxID=2593676 RepID=UPI000C276C03|nr:alpha/beta hydrolase [Streptomyces sp. CB02959]PJN33701.1 alpha/beta hydrolase [Streptomyces sp. CB02959]
MTDAPPAPAADAPDPLSPRARALVDAMSAGFPDPARGPLDAAALRRASRAPRPEPGDGTVTSADRTVPGPPGAPALPVRVYRPDAPAAGPRPLVVFFHGGGWVLCDLDTHDGLCRRLARRCDAVVVSVDYRRAPEDRFPAAAEDAYAATRWALAHAAELGCDPARVAVAGDSSGGNLAAAVTLLARDRGGPPLAAQLLVYPALDHRLAGRSAVEYATGFFHTTAHMRWYWDQYLGPDGDRGNPYASPGLAPDLTGLPPALLVLPACDPLRDEGRAYGRALRDAGVPVRVDEHPDTFHGFLGAAGALPAADAALEAAGSWLADTLCDGGVTSG